MKKRKLFLVAATCLVLAFVLGAYFYKSQQASKLSFMARENAATFVRDYSLKLGSEGAKVYLVEFSDPACETCAQFYPLVKSLMEAHPGQIKLVVRHAPFHPGSDTVVKILEAARKQGKYWETLELLYKNQPEWASHHNPQPQLIWQYLPELGLNSAQIKKDMNDPEIAQHIEQDLADAKVLGVTMTPEFFVNGKALPSFGFEQLRELVESEIEANY
ncbi:MAG: thioredoxin domain-containing protein [Deltaproteobacteria bacterium]|nr:thioredoxin domain-containing protein [Deltaproteobacteria bacterium]